MRLIPSSGTGEHVDFLSMPGAEGRLTSLQDGTVNCAMQLEKLAVPRRSLEGFNWVESDGHLSVIAFMNGRSGPFAWPEARLAANLAIDRDALMSEVMGGHASPAKTVATRKQVPSLSRMILSAREQHCWNPARPQRFSCEARNTCRNEHR